MQTHAWLLPLSLLAIIPIAGKAACFEEAASRYQVPSVLLKAISRVESAGNPNALNRNKDGSFDIGHMQINSRWLPKLSHFGISRDQLWDPCTNTLVGAWISGAERSSNWLLLESRWSLQRGISREA